jgi:hypothetical protein
VTVVQTEAPLDAALTLGANGCCCFPCSADKRPVTPHGFKEASRDRGGLGELWRRYPGPLVGVATGAASGIDVLDLDRKHPEARVWWTGNRSRLPQTRCHRTRSGGLHLLFQHADRLRSTASKVAPRVDTRGDSGYVVWWPAAGLPVLDDTPTAPWPAWLLNQLRSVPSIAAREPTVVIPDDRALARLICSVARAREGQRNRLAFWAACRAGEMARSGLIGFATAEVVIAAAAMRAGLSRREAERTARSGVYAGAGAANV